MIEIGRPFITKEGNFAYLKAPVKISPDTSAKYLEETGKLENCSWLTKTDYPPRVWEDENGGLYFCVEPEYADYLCTERSNAFVVAFLWYAMLAGSDISFEAPLSKKMYEGITKKLMPALQKRGFKPIQLSGPVSDEALSCRGGIVAGMSCGVDSFYTLHSYEKPGILDNGRILTHLCFYVGNYILPYVEPPYNVDAVFDEMDQIYLQYFANAKKIAEHHNLPVVLVKTNLDRDFYRGGCIYTAMYRYLACTLSLEHLYSLYISSSSGHEQHNIDVSLLVPTQNYEDMLCESLRTETLKYQTSDHTLRFEKIKAIADDPDFQTKAEVCFNQRLGQKNCGECFGCHKTMIPLDFIGKLDRFSESFDLDKYYSNREEVFEDVIRYSFCPEADSARDTVRQLLAFARTEDNETAKCFLKIHERICGER